jgi:hypothetical protein
MNTIDIEELDSVTGGASVGGFLRGAGRVAGKLAWPVTAGFAAYDGVTGYNNARAQGHGVARSVGEGALDAVNGATFGLSNWALGR